MTPSIQFDKLYIISDLHFGGEPGFQIFGSQPEMLWFIHHLTEAPADTAIGLVINGDFIDFLAEAPAMHFDPQGAIKKLERIALHDTTFAPIFAALHTYLSTPGRTLIVNLGNHDLELALPWVRQRLIQILTDDDPLAVARLQLVFDGSGVFVGVGGKSVLCVHGNEVDGWNNADFEKIRQIGRDVQFGRPVAPWIPNAGSKMVIDVMNPIKREFPFVDLLKPEKQGVVPTLVACDPSQNTNLDSVLALAGMGFKMAGNWVSKRGMLGAESDPNDVSGAGTGNTASLLAAEFSRADVGGNTDADAMMRQVEQQAKDGVKPMDLVAGNAAGQLGKPKAIFDWIRGRSTSEVLREALEKLDKDQSFVVSAKDETFTKLDADVTPDIDFLLAGHTHLERALKRCEGGGYYFNSGTWARLIQISPKVRADTVQFKALFETLKNGNMRSLDAMPGLIQKFCTVVAIEKVGAAVRGELRHIVTDPASGQSSFTTVPDTSFTRS